MRILAIVFTMLLVASNAGAFNEIHLKKLLYFNDCENCDLSGAYLHKAKLRGANLMEAKLVGADLRLAKMKNTYIKGAIFCKTKMPWGVDNSGCK